jgi:hypothetical protein
VPAPGTRVAISACVGVIAGAIGAVFGPWWLAPLIAWDVASLLQLTWTWRLLLPLDGPTATCC